MQQAPLSALRLLVLRHARIPVAAQALAPAAVASQFLPSRFFGEAAGTYLNKDEVTERVLNVVKNFQKVDPNKVRAFASM